MVFYVYFQVRNEYFCVNDFKEYNGMSPRRAIEKNGIFDLRKHIFNREIGSKTNRFTFKTDLNLHRLENLSLSRHRDVKVVGHGAITSVAIDPLEWRYILAGKSSICKTYAIPRTTTGMDGTIPHCNASSKI